MTFDMQERLIAAFHLVFVVAFAIKIVPQTIWTIHLLWVSSFTTFSLFAPM